LYFPSLLATADAVEEWALACADPERVGSFSGHKSAQSSIQIDFGDMSLVRVTVGLGGVMGFLRNDCRAIRWLAPQTLSATSPENLSFASAPILICA